ncbi:uncharacterized protein LOC134821677 [Bolinopsis microptera]|uniref:uncharacterized protein LOC134821677 n=1 Tax=Bolinopsis microptera TaxID=2820187 RepID=UPI003078FFCB
MGNNESSKLSVTAIPDSYIAISICFNSKIRVMNVTPEVREMLVILDQEIEAKYGSTRGRLIDYYGTVKMHVGDKFTFVPRKGKKRATLGKFFAIRVLEEMYNLCYNLITSSDLAMYSDKSTWFFAKEAISDENRGKSRVCCIAPGGGLRGNKLVLLHHDEHIKQAVMLALEDAWAKGVSGTKDVQSSGEILHEITLKGTWGSTNEDGINTRKAVCSIVGRMGEVNWRLITSTNLKDTADCFFFIYDPTFTAHPNDFCMLSLAKTDRLRLINCNHLLEPLETAITAAGLSIQEKLDYYGSHEIKIHGTPWCSSDSEAIVARRSISRIMEVFGKGGYTPLYAIDMYRSLIDKASILFRKDPFPMNCKYACLSLTYLNTLRLLDFPIDVGVPLRDCIYQFYPFGVQKEVNLPDSNLEINVEGKPWITNTFSKGANCFHMRAVLGKMMAVAAQHGWNT